MDVVPAEFGLTVQERQTRTSFTFRKVLISKKCNCSFKEECDTAKDSVSSNEISIDKNFAFELEKLHVHKVYNEIASHFSDTRHKPWPNVLEFVLSFEIGSILLDVGCGNGKYLGKNKKIFDVSTRNLISF